MNQQELSTLNYQRSQTNSAELAQVKQQAKPSLNDPMSLAQMDK